MIMRHGQPLPGPAEVGRGEYSAGSEVLVDEYQDTNHEAVRPDQGTGLGLVPRFFLPNGPGRDASADPPLPPSETGRGVGDGTVHLRFRGATIRNIEEF